MVVSLLNAVGPICYRSNKYPICQHASTRVGLPRWCMGNGDVYFVTKPYVNATCM